jgi:hypothetical protein
LLKTLEWAFAKEMPWSHSKKMAAISPTVYSPTEFVPIPRNATLLRS